MKDDLKVSYVTEAEERDRHTATERERQRDQNRKNPETSSW